MKFDSIKSVDFNRNTIKNLKEMPLYATTLSVRNNVVRWELSYDIRIKSVYFSVGDAPTGSSIIFSLLKNDGVLQTMEIPSGQTEGTVSVEQDCNYGDILSININQVGSIVAGSNLQVQIIYE